MKNLTLIFDFDGTIADTHHYIVEISNRLSKEYGYKIIQPEEVQILKDKTSQEVIIHLNVPVMKIPAILTRAKKEFEKWRSSLKPIKGLKETLLELKNMGFMLGIVSSNSLENITNFLKNHQMDVFDFIQPTPMVWSKNTALKKILSKHNLNPYQVIYIGDEMRDIDAARKAGLRVISVDWGYNSEVSLKKKKPNYLVHTPEDLLILCRKLQRSPRLFLSRTRFKHAGTFSKLLKPFLKLRRRRSRP